MSSQAKSASPFHKIVLATDGSDNARRALVTAIGLAKRDDAELIVVNAVSFPFGVSAPESPEAADLQARTTYSDLARAEAGKITEDGVRLAKEAGLRARGVVLNRATSAVEQITSFAETEGADLIVAGTRGLSRFTKLFIGSVSSGLLSRASCSVLIVR